MVNCLNPILILTIVLSIFIICSLLSLDHFKPINSLNIRYNAKNVRVPNQLEKPTAKELSMQDKINAELSNHPLTFTDQIYSMNKYPFVGPKQLCLEKGDCETITSECTQLDDPFSRAFGIGACTIAVPHKTVFDIKY